MDGGGKDAPVLGVGVSLSLESEPDPVALARASGGPRFIEYAGRVDVESVREQVERVRATGVPVLFHPSYVNFCGSYPNSRTWLEESARHVAEVGSPWFAQDCAYCFLEEGFGYSTQLGYFVPPIFNAASLERAVERVREVKSVVPVPIAVEPPPMTFAVGTMPLFEFFGELATQADSAILLDVGHVVSYEMATQRRAGTELAALPVERVIELHIAGGRLEQQGERSVYVDAHDRDILPAAWQLLEELLPRLPELKAVCFECEGQSEARVLDTLTRLRELVAANSANPRLVALAQAGA
jgi:uncharacterized protein (UPF0276 family)